VLLQNHGPVVSGSSLDSAVFAIEELEEAAKLAIITRSMKLRLLDAVQIAELDRHFRLK
jgi:ribulose-5-phosphate 4-epimerase/fuculose-1-phosphate aldolase